MKTYRYADSKVYEPDSPESIELRRRFREDFPAIASSNDHLTNNIKDTLAMSARPTRLTDDMRFAAALETAKDVKRDCFDFRDEDVDDMAKQIAAEARYEHMDGYELAKNLDNHCGWMPDTMVVEALDNWSTNARRELEKAQKAWRDATNPQPALKVGDRVRLKSGETGEITDANYQYGVAQYLVKIDGDPNAEKTQARRIVNYEDAVSEETRAA